MSTEVSTITPKQDTTYIQLIRDTVAKGATETELRLFLHACQRTGLDPLMNQIHAIKRWNSALNREEMKIQTGIDGYRLIAERTKAYAPGQRPTYTFKPDGSLDSAIAYIKKLTEEGTWHIVEGEAFWDEYVQTKKDGTPNIMWKTKGRGMLAKCAEALALRKAFPAELSGIYTHEEMMQAENETRMKGPREVITDHEMETVKKDGWDAVKVEKRQADGLDTDSTSTQKVQDAPVPSADDPAEPWIAKQRTANTAQEAKERYEATPEALKQDVWPHYTERLKALAKKK